MLTPVTGSPDLSPKEPQRAAPPPASVADEKRLVVVVHGLGDSREGSAVRGLAGGIAASNGRRMAPGEEVLWLATASDRDLDVFPCHVARLRGDGAESVLAEVYWEDLSRAEPGVVGTVKALVQLIFGLRHLARHAADPRRGEGAKRDRAAAALRMLSLEIAYLLRGPAAAAAALWFLGWLVGVAVLHIDTPGVNTEPWVVGTTCGVSLAAFLVGCWRYRSRGPGRDGLFWSWLAFSGLTAAAMFAAANLMGWTEKIDFGDLWILTNFMAKLPAYPVSLLLSAAVIAWLVARLRAPAVHRPGLDLALSINHLSAFLWVLAILILEIVTLKQLPRVEATAKVEAQMERLLPMFSMNMLFLILLAIAAGGSWIAQRRWAATRRAGDYRPGKPPPRILLADRVRDCLILVAILYFVVWPALALWRPEATAAAVAAFAGRLAAGNELAAWVAVLLGLAVVNYATVGIDFGLDAVSHFRSREGASGPEFPQREAIRDRLRAVLRTMLVREQPDRVTILAHSQGSVIAIDLLASDEAAELLAPGTRVDLVTMGSPFHSFYQHYFASDYPPLADPCWEGLRLRVDCWLNIFRIDDYVGTDIEPGGEWPENLPVDPRGHTDYWIDRQVLRHLIARRFV